MATSGAPGEWFQPGELVEEPHYGRGVVQQAGDSSVPVRFEDGSVRTFDLSHARIRKVPQWEGIRISPSWTEIGDPARFVPSLTHGERELAQYFDTHLPDGWRVYVRPHLDGDLPSLALLHREHGAMLWDVVEPRETGGDGARAADIVSSMRVSPVKRLEDVRRRLFAERITHLAEAWNENHKLIGMVKLGVYFPRNDRDAVAHLIEGHPHATVACRGDLRNGAVDALVPDLWRRVDLDEAGVGHLDRAFSNYWESPPAMGTVELRGQQRQLARPRQGARKLIQGVAGSGKSLVLMHRATRIAQEGRRVLVLTFNRTLTNYLADLRRQIPGRYIQERVLIKHFHGLCVELARLHQFPYLGGGTSPEGGVHDTDEWNNGDDEPGQSFFDEDLPRSALEAIRLGVPSQYRFDALLVDEAQDISPRYLEVVRALLDRPRPEIVAVTDPAQKIYRREVAWDQADVLAEFGKPTVLTSGYRLSRSAAVAASRFAELWSLPTPPIEEPEDGPGLLDGTLSWHQAKDENDAAAAALATVKGWLAEPGSRPGSIAVLVPSKQFGAAFVQLLANHRIGANHVFAVRPTGGPMDGGVASANEVSTRRGRVRFERSMKRSFSPRDQRLKVSTVHSFKGWEADRVVCVLPPAAVSSEDHLAFVYVALTRSHTDLVVIGTSDDLRLSAVLPGRLDAVDDADTVQHFADLLMQAEHDLRRPPRDRAA